MSPSYPPDSGLGAIIRHQRELAELSMRQLAATVGISNPYLSQIERGLRAPSEAVLNAIADSLSTTSDALFAEAGLVPAAEQPGPGDPDELQQAIDAATELTVAQRRALSEIYRGFLEANVVRHRRTAPSADGDQPVGG
jgi:transcriptional regulator with XRE-family HTH domain